MLSTPEQRFVATKRMYLDSQVCSPISALRGAIWRYLWAPAPAFARRVRLVAGGGLAVEVAVIGIRKHEGARCSADVCATRR